MMMSTFLQEAFRRFGGDLVPVDKQTGRYEPGSDFLSQAVEHVLDETSSRLRALPGYRRRLEGPVTEAFHHIDDLVDRMPDSFLCSRSTFSADPRVKTFFASPRHLQEVFSQSRDVRELFDANPGAEECCALVCMHMKEHRKFGVALAGDSIHREVMQTAVSFMDHQVYSPGVSEGDARRALKCCIFNSVLTSIRQRLAESRTSAIERKQKLSMLRAQLRKAEQQGAGKQQQTGLLAQIEDLEKAILSAAQRPSTLEDQLAYVAEVLCNTDQVVSARFRHLHLTHMGIKADPGSKVPAYELDVAEIRVATREPRVAALVRFRRSELLPRMEFLQNADSFFPA
jgi:hypothetical protein